MWPRNEVETCRVFIEYHTNHVGSDSEEAMNASLEKLMELAAKVQMTPQEKEKQRLSFAYGNAKIENSNITYEMVEDAAKKIEREKQHP